MTLPHTLSNAKEEWHQRVAKDNVFLSETAKKALVTRMTSNMKRGKLPSLMGEPSNEVTILGGGTFKVRMLSSSVELEPAQQQAWHR